MAWLNIQTNPINKDTKGAIEKSTVRRAGFDSISLEQIILPCSLMFTPKT